MIFLVSDKITVTASRIFRTSDNGVKGDIDSNKIMMETKQSNNRDNLLYGLTVLVDVYMVIYPTASEYTFSSLMHGAFSRIDDTVKHKTSMNK